MSSFLAGLRHAVRSLARRPTFTVTALLTLALGIGGVTALFSVADAVVLQPLPYAQPENLVRVWGSTAEKARNNVNPLDALDYRRELRSFADLGIFNVGRGVLTGAGEPSALPVARASASLFTTLGVPPALGRYFAPGEEQPGAADVVVLSWELWQQAFAGDPTVIGRTLGVDGRPCQVVGVAPAGFRHPAWELPWRAMLWRPLVIDPARTGRGGHYLHLVARLAPGVTVSQAQAEVTALTDRLARQFPANQGWSALVEPLHDAVAGSSRRPLALLVTAVTMLLLVACLNVATLQLARGASRGQELAVRVALGAGRLRLMRGPLLESALLALAGTAAGAPLAALLLRALRGLGGVQIPRLEEATVDGRALLAAVGSAALTVVIFGLLPAWQQARGAAAAARAGRATAGPRQRRLESALVIAEVGLSLVLLVGAGLLLRSLQQLFAVDPGFAARGALTFGVELPPSGGDDEARRFFATFEEELLALPGAQAVGFVSHLPLSGAYSCDGVTAEGSPLLGDCAESRVATPGYFAAMDLRLLAGRALAAGDGADAEPTVVVNETLARRYWPKGEAVGRRLKWGDSAESGDPWRRVVGVIADVRHFGLDREVLPEVYMPHAQQPYAELEAVVRSAGEPLALVAPARHLVQRLDPRVPLREPRPLVELMAASTAARRFRAWLLAGFAAAALLLAMLGIYGVIAHLVSERRRELCLRAALGAAPAVVRRQVLATAAALAGGGIALGLLASLLVARLLEQLLFGVAPLDPASFLAAPALLLAAGLLAAWLPARRAARLDPVEALRG